MCVYVCMCVCMHVCVCVFFKECQEGKHASYLSPLPTPHSPHLSSLIPHSPSPHFSPLPTPYSPSPHFSPAKVRESLDTCFCKASDVILSLSSVPPTTPTPQFPNPHHDPNMSSPIALPLILIFPCSSSSSCPL